MFDLPTCNSRSILGTLKGTLNITLRFCKDHITAVLLIFMIQRSSEAQRPKNLLFCSDVAHGTIPLVLGTLIVISEVTSLPSEHLQSCMPTASCVTENKRTMSPKEPAQRGLCLLDLDSSLIMVAPCPTTVPIQRRPLISIMASAKSAHNSTQHLTLHVPVFLGHGVLRGP